jgi:hypothetical protein
MIPLASGTRAFVQKTQRYHYKRQQERSGHGDE